MTNRRPAHGQQPRQERQGDEDNPFAPPPEGQPDQPWRPRHPQGAEGNGGERGEGEQQEAPHWGGQWSARQPQRQGGRWGEPPNGPERQGGFGGPRWDPSDPAQRHARYAMLAGMWGVCGGVLLGWEWLALLLGALALYWGVSALRGGPKDGKEARERRVRELQGQAPPVAVPPGEGAAARVAARKDRPQLTAAISGLVLAGLSLAIVAASYTLQLVYKDYFDCVDQALTKPSRESCEVLLPSELRPFLGEQN
ncbi:hypothetical protein [Streptomyces hoynatensis]|uniref:Integral membrane protein n=1 Tax=Streptomyces hoynatensis TaxID=1141874 RepID=A0A3A9ZF52_9ACTN|nr:hypothetical protein [Streptomyces hoynatensis]RKN46859.1 hypothetical protein D7294_01185 [Streptomyces hoynatensis]